RRNPARLWPRSRAYTVSRSWLLLPPVVVLADRSLRFPFTPLADLAFARQHRPLAVWTLRGRAEPNPLRLPRGLPVIDARHLRQEVVKPVVKPAFQAIDQGAGIG